MAASTFVLATGTGHVMQLGTPIPGPGTLPTGAGGRQVAAAVPLIDQSTPIIPLSAGPTVPGDLPELPKGPEAGPVVLRADTGLAARIGALDAAAGPGGGAADIRYTAFGFACTEPKLRVERAADGALSAMLDAPCEAGQAVRVTLGALHVNAMTDSSGRLDLALPDLGDVGTVSAVLEGGASVSAAVPSGSPGDTIVLRWSGEAVFDLDARRADGSAVGVPVAYRYGTGPSSDTVVALPLAGVTTAINLDVVAEITPRTCGTTVTAKLIHTGEGGSDREVAFDLPDCSAVGDLVLLPVQVDPVELATN
jgi:hypothetical protein